MGEKDGRVKKVEKGNYSDTTNMQKHKVGAESENKSPSQCEGIVVLYPSPTKVCQKKEGARALKNQDSGARDAPRAGCLGGKKRKRSLILKRNKGR